MPLSSMFLETPAHVSSRISASARREWGSRGSGGDPGGAAARGLQGTQGTWYDLSLRSWLTPLPAGACTRLMTRQWRAPVSFRTTVTLLTIPYLPQRPSTGFRVWQTLLLVVLTESKCVQRLLELLGATARAAPAALAP